MKFTNRYPHGVLTEQEGGVSNDAENWEAAQHICRKHRIREIICADAMSYTPTPHTPTPLQRAADGMRKEPGDYLGATFAAVADWLDAITHARAAIDGLAEYRKTELGAGSALFLDMERYALAVARAYLGESA